MMKMLSLALLSAFVVAARVLAINSNRTMRVGFQGEHVGNRTFRSRVVDRGETCRYTVRWANEGSPLGRTVRCVLEEYKAGDNFDCEENRRTEFDTLVSRSAGSCHGFDEFGQQTRIETLVAGQDSSGNLDSVVMTDSIGDVQNFHAQ